MMLYVDKKMLHESLPDHEFGPLRTGRGRGPHGREHRRGAHAAPRPAHDSRRREVLARVVRISRALNQRLAL